MKGQAMRSLAFLLTHLLSLRVWAEQIPLGIHHAITPTGNDRAVSRKLFAGLEELARLVDITYCVNPGNPGISKPFECLSRCATFSTLELVTTWHTGLLLTDSAGYIALDHAKGRERILIAFRGTQSLANVVVDLATIPHEYVPYLPGNGTGDASHGRSSNNVAEAVRRRNGTCEDCAVHLGFYQSWLDAHDTIMPTVASLRAVHPEYGVELVGHSLGGAVATLAGLDMEAHGWDPTVTTFGQPRVGNGAFARWVDDSFGLDRDGVPGDGAKFRRVTHVDDPVPLLPLTVWGYTPHAGEIYITKPDVPPEVEDLRLCRGNLDAICSAGPIGAERLATGTWPDSWYNPFSALSGHRNYFWTLGLCVPDLWKGGPHRYD